MDVPVRKAEPMSVEEFFAFTDARPDDEKWELIDGEPIMSPSASFTHQIIVGNLLFFLGDLSGLSRPLPIKWQRQPALPLRSFPANPRHAHPKTEGAHWGRILSCGESNSS